MLHGTDSRRRALQGLSASLLVCAGGWLTASSLVSDPAAPPPVAATAQDAPETAELGPRAVIAPELASLARLRPGSPPVSSLQRLPLPPPAAAPEPVPPAAPPASEPVRVRLPRLGIDSELSGLGLDERGRLEVPAAADVAGWFTGAPVPGELGPAVLVGHVDSRRGPGVFYALREALPGDRVEVDRADGTTAVFVVERVEQYPKDRFPTQDVYGDVDHPALRLITCGGAFDRSTRHYLANVVVYARLDGVRPSRT